MYDQMSSWLSFNNLFEKRLEFHLKIIQIEKLTTFSFKAEEILKFTEPDGQKDGVGLNPDRKCLTGKS